ncbi:MarR family winged helix-turn-helix transcriptional regulator [Paraburkholderia flagellata]|uniref:MarR family winged helix-turn-helix transcriptional regulator n=1 Tax=Paraburkholderia flagellata TaxID=2883241 RepID=UPI001F39C51D|nr:MarR family transcriptional regulator [Paraburkholderia flagellata]
MNTLPLYVDDCFAIRQAARHISKLYERHLSEVGVTPTQFSILSTLARAPGLTMLEIAEAMVMDRTTLIRTLKPLERNGLVGESSEIGNKRRLRLHITASGRAKLDKAIGHWRTAQASFETSFGEREAARLRLELFRLTSDNSWR